MFDRKAWKAEATRLMSQSEPRCWKVLLLWALLAGLLPSAVTQAVQSPMAEINNLMLGMGDIDPELLFLLMQRLLPSLAIGMVVGVVVALYSVVINFGLVNYSLQLSRGGGGFSDLFAGFGMIGRILGINLLIGLIMFGLVMLMVLGIMLILFVFGVVAVLVDSYEATVFMTVVSGFASVAVVIAAVLVMLVVSLPFALSEYALADQPELGTMGAISRSIQLMRGNKWNFFEMCLSFVGWVLLMSLPGGAATGLITVLAAFLPTGVVMVLSVVFTFVATLPHLLWLTPYMHITYAQCYLALRGPDEAPAVPELPGF